MLDGEWITTVHVQKHKNVADNVLDTSLLSVLLMWCSMYEYKSLFQEGNISLS